MDTQAELEQIRARVAADYRTADGNRALYATDLAIADLRTLLRIIDRQQGVIQAAGEVDAKAVHPGRKVEGRYARMYDELIALHDALAALEGAEDGDA